jgi:SAM-dependent methyltransferase
MSQFHFTPADYLELMRSELPAFHELQEAVAVATEGLTVARILELGTGTGETARRVLERHPAARLTGIDVSAEMLAAAAPCFPRIGLTISSSGTSRRIPWLQHFLRPRVRFASRVRASGTATATSRSL